MRGGISMKWAMVCSVEEDSLLPDLTDFGIWLCEALKEKAFKLGLTHEFDPRPEIVLRVDPSDYYGFVGAYAKISDEYPGVLLVIQILPSQKSLTYLWMKELSEKYGKVRQGVVLENALSRFAGLDLNLVLTNILSWISRRISFATNQKEGYRYCNLRVGPSNETTMPPEQSLRMNGVESTVQAVIHSCDIVDRDWPIPSLKVSGFPSSFNQYQLASIFYNFNVVAVHFAEEDCAVVSFVNKFHAVQAAMLFNNLQLDAEHVLEVTPIYEQLREQVAFAKTVPTH